jgi:hypothetical protein
MANLGEIIREKASTLGDIGFTDPDKVKHLEARIGVPDNYISMAQLAGWEKTFKEYMNGTIMPHMDGSCGQTSDFLREITTGPAASVTETTAVDAFLHELAGAGARAYARGATGPHSFFIEKLGDDIRVYQSFFHGHCLAKILPSPGGSPPAIKLDAFGPQLHDALILGASIPDQKQKAAQQRLFYGCSFYTGATIAFSLNKNPASEHQIKSAIDVAVNKNHELWKFWMTLEAPLNAMWE